MTQLFQPIVATYRKMEITKIVFKEDGVFGEVRLFSENERAGKMDISVADGKIRVYHTEVNPKYEGRRFSKVLLHQLVNYAKENSLRIIPLCPYVLSEFRKHPADYVDVWLKKGM